ncbi:hypothetical protein [Nocardia carnea]|uniref:DUF2273 domain-containing protein n=1 Tax=Nocardia carnea TaxID=37328 RepID=A0ABW7TH45_9NOCA|nr:hypothetical protein [Nocardia carnea]
MPGLRKFFRDTAYTVLGTTVVAALLILGFGFSGIWVTVVSVTAGMALGWAAEGSVELLRACRAGATQPAGDLGTATQDPPGT